MSREIKFRVWNGESMLYPEHFIFNQTWTFNTNWSAFEENFSKATRITGKALMQYTGLRDKNDVEIFEGDILNIVNGQTGQIYVNQKTVTFNEYSARFNGLPLTHQCEVIGNIYENPELLEGRA